jgi:hypothetical protein
MSIRAYVPHGFSRNVSLVMFFGFLSNVSSYVPRCHMIKEYNLYSLAPMCMLIYVFLRYVPRLCS